MLRPFRFGVVAASAQSGKQWAELARTVEAAGYDILLTPDNLSFGLSPLPALAAAAAATVRLRVGTYVLANDYRHPVQVAKDAVTLATLTDGRFELGIGAGRPGAERELAMIGKTWDPPRTRIDHLEQSVSMIRRLLAGQTVTVDDGHYESRDACVTDQPVSIPLLIAASRPRMSRVAGALANIAALGVQPTATADEVAAQIAAVRSAAGGRDIELNLNLMAVDGIMPAHLRRMLDPAALATADSMTAVAGTTPDMADQLRRRREELGISYYLVGDELMAAFAPVVGELSGE